MEEIEGFWANKHGWLQLAQALLLSDCDPAGLDEVEHGGQRMGRQREPCSSLWSARM